MPRHLALVRAVNVGGRNKVPMAELRALAGDLGYASVRTYIASGNLIFHSENTDAACAAELTAAIPERFGFAVDVVVASKDVLTRAVAAHPYADGDPKRVHVGFASGPIPDSALDRLRAVASASERVTSDGTLLYADLADGVHDSKLAASVTPALKPEFVTLRNLATCRTLLQLMTD